MAHHAGMNGAPTPEAIDRDVRTLKEAVRVVLGGYGGTPSGDPKERLRATEWLHSFQRRDDAWSACVAVLGAPRGVADNQVGLNEQIFASQALLYKCRRRRAVISGDDVGCLLQLALQFTGRGLRAVLVQLCLGVCACAVRHSGWDSSKVVPDMVMYCQKASEDAGHGDPGPRVLMLELLTVLPDEATARAGISAPPERRKEFLWTLRQGGGAGRLALGVLSQLMEPGGLPAEGAVGATLRCALAWMQLEAVERADMLASPVMALALEALESPEACDDACELVTVSLEAFTEPEAAEEMLPRVLTRAQALANAPSEEVCRCLAMVFASAACAYLPGILKPELGGHWSSLLQIMVGMLEHPSLEIASLALEFWGMLGELLTETAAGGRGPRSPPLEESVRHACRVSMLRARYPSDDGGGLGGMDEDSRDELEDFRDQVQELLQTLIMPAPPWEQNQQRSSSKGGGAAETPSPPRPGFHSRGSGGGGVFSGRGWERAAGVNGIGAAMSPDNGPGMHPGRRSSPSLSTAAATAAVTLDGSRRSNSDGGGSASGRRRSLGEDGAGMDMVLSPVQSGLLEWLEGLAASSTREALQEQQQRRYSGTSTNGTAGGGLDGSVNSGGSGGADPSTTAQAGGREGGGALLDGAAGGGGRGGDWSGVEVALRMLSAVTKAINLRDFCSPSPSSAAPALLGGAGTNGDAATTAAAAAAAFRGYVPADSGTVGDGGRGTGATEALVEMLPSLPPGRRELQRSAAVLVGGLAAWLARRPRSLEPALQSVLGVLGLEEEGGGQAFMRDKGEDHVGAVALSKLVSAAGPSLAAVPSLPTHLLQRYLGLSSQLQSHRLLRPRPVAEGRGPPPGPAAPAAQPLPSERLAVSGRGTGSATFPWQAAGDDRPLSLEQQRRLAEAGGGGKAADAAAAAARPPPLHAGSLRLFLGSICRMLGEAPRAGAVLEQQRGGGSGTGSTVEVEEVLQALVEGELRCLGSVLDRRRELAVVAAATASPHAADEENRAMADVAKDSLSNLSLILGKTGPALDAPGLVAKLCGLGEGSAASAGAYGGGGGRGAGEGGDGGVLVAMVAAFSLGEESILPHLCLLFEALVLSTSRRMRYFKGEALPRPGVNGNGGGVSSTTTSSHPIVTVGRPQAGAAGGGEGGRLVEEGDSNASAAAVAAATIGGLRVSTALGDALAEAFRRRPFHRFLVSLRCITAELPTLGRSFTSADPGVAATPPDMSLRASEWVDQSLWAAAAGVAAGGSNGIVVGSGNEHNSNRSSAEGIGGGGAPPELVEALFKLMAEWVKELPVPSLRWLEAWLSVAVSGLAVRHRGPARAVLGLIQACCSQRKSLQFTATFSALLRGTALGVALTRGLLSGMCGAMPSWMLDDLVLTVRSLFDSLSPAAASSCVDAVLRDPSFERHSVTNEHKVAFSRKLKEDFCNKDWRAFKAGLKAFCGGKKKGTGGTPPVHASVAAAAAAAGRRSAPQHSVPLNPLLVAGQHHHHHF